MARRIRPLNRPVRFLHDGQEVLGDRGEPLALGLIAENRLPIARSAKLHRPRGPYCLRAGCDGCLARVNGVPNVMTCAVELRGDERVETQNVVGSRDLDLLRATDFLFPNGVDHHRLFAGVPVVSEFVQAFARRAAGLGRLPDGAVLPVPARRRHVQTLVVGGGAAGLAAARQLGNGAWLVDDGIALGGSLAALDPARAASAIAAARASGARLESRATAIGLYTPDEPGDAMQALIVTSDGATFARAESVILATGRHSESATFEGNDLPGVWSARAALALYRYGILVGDRIVIAGSGRFADALERALTEEPAATNPIVRVALSSLARVVGRSRVSGVVLESDSGAERLRADALVVDGPGSPSAELWTQSGGEVRFDSANGFVPARGDSSPPRVFFAGSVRGAGADSERQGRDAAELARSRPV